MILSNLSKTDNGDWLMNRRQVAIAALLVVFMSVGAWALSSRRAPRPVWAVVSVTKQSNGDDAVSVYAGPRDGVLELQASAKHVEVQRSLPKCVTVSLEGDVHVTSSTDFGRLDGRGLGVPTDPEKRLEFVVWDDGSLTVRQLRK